MTRLTGQKAIDHARENGLTLNKYADPTEDAREGLTPDEAEEIAREDAGLIWIETDDDQTGHIYYRPTDADGLSEPWQIRIPVERRDGDGYYATGAPEFYEAPGERDRLPEIEAGDRIDLDSLPPDWVFELRKAVGR